MTRIIWFVSLLMTTPAIADTLSSVMDEFSATYKKELGSVKPCAERQAQRYSVCSDTLRNEGNSPFILHHDKPVNNVAVLFHGLSDSPYFMQAIAGVLFDNGFNVVVPLLPGHGKREADADMSDSQLAERWQTHVDEIMTLAAPLGEKVYIGGFSTGGALAVDQYLDEPDSVDGIMLFSGALALSDNAETMWKIWGIKLLARLIDGDYATRGPNPYKYPAVAGFAGLELMDIIDHIRERLDAGRHIEVPVFVAHSQADNTTPVHGVTDLLGYANGKNTLFEIDEEYDLCHADLPLNRKLVADMHFDKSQVNAQERCAVPKPNPLFRQMSMMLKAFVAEQTPAQDEALDSGEARPYISYDDFQEKTR
ncbi:alpha/beta hydrolase [Salinimonas lutimaris]|uniref:alpha/beta hydrolase n=1 Tax=Salinimonas lutimaris TaxID=914153 RepID=UPI0010C1074A